MANFCKTCGRPVRRDDAGWVHYDEHITHSVALVVSREKFTHSVEQPPANWIPPQHSAARAEWLDALYFPFMLMSYVGLMALAQYYPAASVFLTMALLIYHFGIKRPLR